MDWPKLFKGKNVDECTHVFLWVIKMVCCELIPKKNNKCKSKIPIEGKKMINRIKMIKRKRHSTKTRMTERNLKNVYSKRKKKIAEHREQ